MGHTGTLRGLATPSRSETDLHVLELEKLTKFCEIYSGNRIARVTLLQKTRLFSGSSPGQAAPLGAGLRNFFRFCWF